MVAKSSAPPGHFSLCDLMPIPGTNETVCRYLSSPFYILLQASNPRSERTGHFREAGPLGLTVNICQSHSMILVKATSGQTLLRNHSPGWRGDPWAESPTRKVLRSCAGASRKGRSGMKPSSAHGSPAPPRREVAEGREESPPTEV